MRDEQVVAVAEAATSDVMYRFWVPVYRTVWPSQAVGCAAVGGMVRVGAMLPASMRSVRRAGPRWAAAQRGVG